MAIIPPDPLFVDTNVPMYAAGGEHPYREPCLRILDAIRRGNIEAVSDCEVHQEIMYRYLAVGLPDKARGVSQTFQQLVPNVLPIQMADLVRARELSTVYPRLSARDLLHLAIMLNNGIKGIITADTDFDGVQGLQRWDPIALAGSLAT
ncbi:MAG: hypothetical protein HW403_229 [Dehalococcoidia bacterium]|nr:hypothetical protein [Dehalococcoidia bacterium]